MPLQALPLPVSLWESEVLPRRVPAYRPVDLDALCASGDVVWLGAGLDRVAVYFREDAAVLGRPAAEPPPEELPTSRSGRRSGRARCSGATCSLRPSSTPVRRSPPLWDLVWAGEVTNDSWAPLRAARRYEAPRPERGRRRFMRSRATAASPTQGRWALARSLFPEPAERRAWRSFCSNGRAS